MRRALMLAGCGVATLGLSACESTEHESAQIGRESQPASTQPTKAAKRKHHKHLHHGNGKSKSK